jgi:hypothetical protein
MEELRRPLLGEGVNLGQSGPENMEMEDETSRGEAGSRRSRRREDYCDGYCTDVLGAMSQSIKLPSLAYCAYVVAGIGINTGFSAALFSVCTGGDALLLGTQIGAGMGAGMVAMSTTISRVSECSRFFNRARLLRAADAVNEDIRARVGEDPARIIFGYLGDQNK